MLGNLDFSNLLTLGGLAVIGFIFITSQKSLRAAAKAKGQEFHLLMSEDGLSLLFMSIIAATTFIEFINLSELGRLHGVPNSYGIYGLLCLGEVFFSFIFAFYVAKAIDDAKISGWEFLLCFIFFLLSVMTTTAIFISMLENLQFFQIIYQPGKLEAGETYNLFRVLGTLFDLKLQVLVDYDETGRQVFPVYENGKPIAITLGRFIMVFSTTILEGVLLVIQTVKFRRIKAVKAAQSNRNQSNTNTNQNQNQNPNQSRFRNRNQNQNQGSGGSNSGNPTPGGPAPLNNNGNLNYDVVKSLFQKFDKSKFEKALLAHLALQPDAGKSWEDVMLDRIKTINESLNRDNKLPPFLKINNVGNEVHPEIKRWIETNATAGKSPLDIGLAILDRLEGAANPNKPNSGILGLNYITDRIKVIDRDMQSLNIKITDLERQQASGRFDATQRQNLDDSKADLSKLKSEKGVLISELNQIKIELENLFTEINYVMN